MMGNGAEEIGAQGLALFSRRAASRPRCRAHIQDWPGWHGRNRYGFPARGPGGGGFRLRIAS